MAMQTQPDYSDINADNVMGATDKIAATLLTAFAEEHTEDRLITAVLEHVASLNRNELAAVLTSFIVSHFHLDPEAYQS